MDKDKEKFIQKVTDNGQIFAIIVSNEFRNPGVSFFTPNEFSQQLAYMRHPKGKKIDPHIHNSVKREVVNTEEVLVIKRGKLRVDFYSENRAYLESRLLSDGDVILLARGGHGFEVLEEVEMIEIKQGPYTGESDKSRFNGVVDTNIRTRK